MAFQDPKHRVVNLCSGDAENSSSSPWLCNAAERSGLLKAELQLDRASTIAYIDVGQCSSAINTGYQQTRLSDTTLEQCSLSPLCKRRRSSLQISSTLNLSQLAHFVICL